MIESHSDLWSMNGAPGHLICISTNGFVKRNGCAVMGRGCARQATQLYLGVARQLGHYIRQNGNVPGLLHLEGYKVDLGILPVKHNWWEKASLELIQRSVDWLQLASANKYILETHLNVLHVPRLGCGNGGRDWAKEVRPMMQTLPDNVVVHS